MFEYGCDVGLTVLHDTQYLGVASAIIKLNLVLLGLQIRMSVQDCFFLYSGYISGLASSMSR